MQENRVMTIERQQGFRSEIQGLRAIAIGLVLIYHLSPYHLKGGFVGVDIFFVISGFLITAHLYKEVAETGRVKLLRFWARRIRRLLPLSFLVLAASLVVMLLIVPSADWVPNIRQIIGSTFYVQNWVLAADAVDYSAQEEGASLVTHYWSLSVEEQFYIFLPILVILVAMFSGYRARVRAGERGRALAEAKFRNVLIWVLAAVLLASFCYSVLYTASNPSEAYFSTFTRMWEFMIGSMVALLGVRIHGRLGNLLGWAGVGLIVVAAFVLSEAKPFPSYTAALPTLGAALVLMAGRKEKPWDVYTVASWPISQKLGDYSYAIYLWHWPLIICAGYVFDHVRMGHKIGIVVLCIVLAALSKILVEDPARFSRVLQPQLASLAMMCVGMLVLTSAAHFIPQAITNARTGKPLDTADRCYGPKALLNGCSPVEGNSGPFPDSAAAVAQNRDHEFLHCQNLSSTRPEEETHCVYGAGKEEKDANTILLGDSHAVAWSYALRVAAEHRGLTVKTYFRSACVPIDLPLSATDPKLKKTYQYCPDTMGAAIREAKENPKIKNVIFIGARTDGRAFIPQDGGPASRDAGVHRLAKVWEELEAAGKKVIVFHGVPDYKRLNIPRCASEHPNDLGACSVKQEKTPKIRGFLPRALEVTKAHPVAIDPAPWFCRDGRCHGIVGTLMVFRDSNHLTVEYSTALGPLLEEEFRKAKIGR